MVKIERVRADISLPSWRVKMDSGARFESVLARATVRTEKVFLLLTPGLSKPEGRLCR
jgi:hypothetical protein